MRVHNITIICTKLLKSIFFDSDGTCVNMKMRCDSIVDCPNDEADETSCSKVLLSETYNRYLDPISRETVDGKDIIKRVKTC